jgi:hypothetical protein
MKRSRGHLGVDATPGVETELLKPADLGRDAWHDGKVCVDVDTLSECYLKICHSSKTLLISASGGCV